MRCWPILFFLAAGLPTSAAQRPVIGAQVWLGQDSSPADIDLWFKLLAEHKMPLARIFVPSESKPDSIDAAFRAAEKHGVRIAATLSLGAMTQSHRLQYPVTRVITNSRSRLAPVGT